MNKNINESWGAISYLRDNKESAPIQPPSNGGSASSPENMDVYFASTVDDSSILNLTKELREKEKVSLGISAQYGVSPIPIKLYISSGGGSLLSGFGGCDVIRTLKVPVHTIISGYAASAATILSIVGTKRFMYKRSHILIHQLSSMAWGKYAEIKDEIENLDNFMKMIKDLYVEYTKVPKKQLDEILKRDIWWDSQKAKEYGLIDEIL
jgi:ATP-dependent Clp endopeptidase proteolytic subunit ClpP